MTSTTRRSTGTRRCIAERDHMMSTSVRPSSSRGHIIHHIIVVVGLWVFFWVVGFQSRRVFILHKVFSRKSSSDAEGGIGLMMTTTTADDEDLSTVNVSSSHTPPPPNSRILPIRNNEEGMIIVFVHTPKTGGTTIRKMFEDESQDDEVKYYEAWGRKYYERYVRKVNRILDGDKTIPKGQLVFFELHAGDAPSYLEFRTSLRQWRSKAALRHIPFFAFALVREPVSFVLSYFVYYHTAGHHRGFTYLEDPTEADFISATIANPQCLFLSRTEEAYREPPGCIGDHHSSRNCGTKMRQNFTKAECEAVSASFSQDLDWVGTTERLSDETLKILRAVANLQSLNNIQRRRPPKRNESTKQVNETALSQSTYEWLHNNMTEWDRELYEHAQRDFSMSMWKNY